MNQIHVTTDSDFDNAAKQAAFNYPAEVLVSGRNPNDELVVYSDDDTVWSSSWWRNTINKYRVAGSFI